MKTYRVKIVYLELIINLSEYQFLTSVATGLLLWIVFSVFCLPPFPYNNFHNIFRLHIYHENFPRRCRVLLTTMRLLYAQKQMVVAWRFIRTVLTVMKLFPTKWRDEIMSLIMI